MRLSSSSSLSSSRRGLLFALPSAEVDAMLTINSRRQTAMAWLRSRWSLAAPRTTWFGTERERTPRGESLVSWVVRDLLLLVKTTCSYPRLLTMASQAGPSSSLQTPDKIGPLFFCSSCGSLLDVPKDEDVIACVPCGAHLDASGERQSHQRKRFASVLIHICS